MIKSKRINLKKYILLTMLMLLIFCLCGCAEVNFVTYHNADGSICEYVYLIINEQQLESYGYNINDVKFKIRTNSYNEAQLLVKQYQTQLYNEYQQKQITNEEYTHLYRGVAVIEQEWQENEYTIGLKYTSSASYKKYYELLNNATFSSNTKQIEKTFYTKTYYYGSTNYGDYTIFNRIYNYYANSVFSTISPQETTLNYSYSVSTKRFHSDADSVTYDTNGNYIHTWKVDPTQPAKQIYFYTISANRSMWIIACLGIGLTTCAILCVVGLIKYKNFHKNMLDKPDENNYSENKN